MARWFAGVDVAGPVKGQVLAVLDPDRRVVALRWGLVSNEVAAALAQVTGGSTEVVVAVDASRWPAPGPKAGRQCERLVNRLLGHAHPQWTPAGPWPHQGPQANRLGLLPGRDAPSESAYAAPRTQWLRHGFQVFADLEAALGPDAVLEVFPTASYPLLETAWEVAWPLALCHHQHKADQLDAVCCALVAWAHGHGLTAHLGDPAREGAITIPWGPTARAAHGPDPMARAPLDLARMSVALDT